ncbi:low-density lipoprotein receptor-related protein 6-like isoform X2 [Argopecten irradians]
MIMYGPEANEGYVTLVNGTVSYTMCYDGWDDENAAVVCRMLGYTSVGAIAVHNVTTANPDLIWPHQFDCDGSETSLHNCPTSEIKNVTECVNYGSPGVFCSKEPVPDDFFLLSFVGTIARMDRVSESLTIVLSVNITRVIAIDYDPTEQYIYWTDITLDHIARCDLNGGEITVIYQTGSESVMDGIAVDSASRLIFYTDTGYDEIGVIDMRTLNRTVLFNSSLEEPRKIIFDSNTREIFWSDWGTNATIERANYDGSGREVIVDSGIIWPNGLVLDGDHLYWCDAYLDVVERIGRDLTGRIMLYSTGLVHCFDFVLVDEYFYCNDWSSDNIIRFEKNGSDISPYGPRLQQRWGLTHYRKGTYVVYLFTYFFYKSEINSMFPI